MTSRKHSSPRASRRMAASAVLVGLFTLPAWRTDLPPRRERERKAMKRRPLNLSSVAAALALGILLQAVPASAQAAASPGRSMRVLHDLQYYAGPGADAKLHAFDLFLPEGKTNVPMLFFIHGGGWRGGDKVYAGLDNIVNICIDMGIGVMSVNYRLSPAVKHPTHIQDVARAFAWLYNNGRQYGVDRDRIFVAGGSAGGHLAALLGLDARYLGEHQLSPKMIKGVMSFSGAYDMAHLYTVGASPGAVRTETQAGSGNSAKGGLYNMVIDGFGTDYETLRSASPAVYVGKMGKDTPPYLIAYTEDDMWGFDEQAVTLYSLFVRQGLPVELLKQPGRTHQTKTSGIGRRERGADDVLGPAIKRFITTVLDGTFAETAKAVWPGQRATTPAMQPLKDIRYLDGPGSDAKLNALDLYLPMGKENVPLLFNVHGGGWTGGDKALPQDLIDVFARLGVAVASVNYRTSPAVKHPTHIQDVARAFAYMYKNAAQYKIDRNRIVIMGSSAGAHLVALLGLNTKHLTDQGLPADAIKGVAAISGIYDLPTFPEPGLVPTRREQAFGFDPVVLHDASPQSFASAKAPPFLLTFTNWDIFMLREQALELFNRLLTQGAPVELVDVPGRDHGSTGTIGEPVRSRYVTEDVLGPALARFVWTIVKPGERTKPPTAPGAR